MYLAAAQAGTPSTQGLSFFLYRQRKITQEFYTKSTPQCLAKYLHKIKSTLGVTQNHKTRQAHIYMWRGMFIQILGVKAGWCDFSVHTGKCIYAVCLNATNPPKDPNCWLSFTNSMCVLVRDSFSTGTFKCTHSHITVFFKPTWIMAVRVQEDLKWDVAWQTWRGYKLCFSGTNSSLSSLLRDEHYGGLNAASLCTECSCLMQPHPVAYDYGLTHWVVV